MNKNWIEMEEDTKTVWQIALQAKMVIFMSLLIKKKVNDNLDLQSKQNAHV